MPCSPRNYGALVSCQHKGHRRDGACRRQCTTAQQDLTRWRVAVSRAGSAFPRFRLACLPDGAVLATGDESGTVRLWDLTEGTAEPEMASFAAHQDAITDLCFSPDGKLLATVGADFSVALWGVPAEAQG